MSDNSLKPCEATQDRIAQSVERWSNKPLVMGSIPIVIKILLFLLLLLSQAHTQSRVAVLCGARLCVYSV